MVHNSININRGTAMLTSYLKQLNNKRITTYGIGNSVPSVRHDIKCGGAKPNNAIPAPSLIFGSQTETQI